MSDKPPIICPFDGDCKEAVKEAAKEWLEEQSTKFGKWTLKTLGAFFLIGFIVLIVKFGGR